MKRHLQATLLAGAVLMVGTVAHAQVGRPPGGPAAGGGAAAGGAAPTAPLGSSQTTTSSSSTDITTAIPGGDAIPGDAVSAGTPDGGLGNTGGEPILMALGGTLIAGSALLLRRKLA